MTSLNYTSKNSIPIDYGRERLVLVFLMIFGAGVDVRPGDLRLPGPGSNPLELLMLLAMGLLLADTIIYNKQPTKMVASAWNANKLVVLFFSWAMIAAVIGTIQLFMSFFIFRNIFPSFVFFIYLIFGTRKSKDLGTTFLIFLLAALPNIFLGLSQFAFKTPYPVKINSATALKMDIDGSFVQTTITGLFNHPNGLSVFLLPVFITAFGLSISSVTGTLLKRFFAIGMFIASGALLYLTRAKGAWAWGIAGIFILLLPGFVLKLRGAWVGFVIATILGIVALIVGSQLMGSVTKTMMTRVYLWDSAYYAISHSFFIALFGSGQEAVWAASARLSDTQYPNSHNTFLNQAINFGLPAMILYISAFILAIKHCTTAYAAAINPGIREVARICLAVLVAMAGHYFFEPASDSSGWAVEALLFIGLASMSLRFAKAE
jgi:hypothetical protein